MRASLSSHRGLAPARRARAGPNAPRVAAPPTPPPTDALERSLALPAADTKAATSRRSTEPLLEGDSFESTPTHRAIVGGTSALLAALFAAGVSDVHSGVDAAITVAAVAAGYVAADFGTAVYHWSVDNYGDANTPIVGGQIAAFQGHHVRPWTITERAFANNVHKVFAPAAPVAGLGLVLAPFTPGWADVFGATVVALACLSQQFHAWAHSRPSTLPGWVKAAQDAGLLVSRAAHGAHHRAPFDGNYAIVSGMWNPVLDAGGDDAFFRRLERVVLALTGVEPRCWHDPDTYDFFEGQGAPVEQSDEE